MDNARHGLQVAILTPLVLLPFIFLTEVCGMEPQKWGFGNIYYNCRLRIECKRIFNSVYAQSSSSPVNDSCAEIL